MKELTPQQEKFAQLVAACAMNLLYMFSHNGGD